MIDCQLSAGALSQILKRDFRFPFPYHEVYNDQALENDGPRRITKSIRKRSEDLRYAGFAGMGCDEDMLDIF